MLNNKKIIVLALFSILCFNIISSFDVSQYDYIPLGNVTNYNNITYTNVTNNFIGGNLTFNQTLTDELYISQSDESSLNVNSSTWWAGLTGWVTDWFFSVGNELQFNETKLNLTIDARASGGNTSWNQTFANELYLKLDQTNEQDIINGVPTFTEGLNSSGVIQIDKTDASGIKIGGAGADGNYQLAFGVTPLGSGNKGSYIQSGIDGEPLDLWTYLGSHASSRLYHINDGTTFTLYNNETPGNYGQFIIGNAPKVGYNFLQSNHVASGTTLPIGFYIDTFQVAKMNATGLYENDSRVCTENNGICLGGGNASWNESYANTLYASYLWNYNQTLGVDQTYVEGLGFVTGAHTVDTNETIRFENLVENNCNGNDKMIGVYPNGTIECSPVAGGGDFSFADFQASWNSNWTALDYDKWMYNQTTATYDLYNDNWASTYNSTYDNYIQDNSSWNESYADTKYSNRTNLSQLDDVEITSPQNESVLIWDVVMNKWRDSSLLSLVGFKGGWNFFDGFGNIAFNETKLNDTIDLRASGLGDNASWNETLANTLYLGIDNQKFNETDLILSLNTTNNIMNLGFYNESEVDNLISVAGNFSWNQTFADTLYYSISNPSEFINFSQASVFNDTTLVLEINSTIWQYIANNEENWLLTYNETYAGLINNASYLSTYNATYDSKVTDNESWNQSLADNLYANVAGDTFIGTVYTNSTLKANGNVFIDDIEEGTHHINVDLENLDELYANVFLTPLNIETFRNATGTYVNITAKQGETSITVNLATSTSANNYRLQYNNITLPLTIGTNETPLLNRVYVKLVGDTPTWEVSIIEPTVKHAMASRILLGANDTIYGSSLQEDGQNGFLKRVQRRFRKEGLLYEDGFDFVATPDDLEIGNGSYINGIYDSFSYGKLNISNGFFDVRSDGEYVWKTDVSDITEYSDGTSIGNNKYFNIIFGVIPYDGTSNIYAVIQSEPKTEYTSVALAYADASNTLSVYPSEDFLKIMFLPVARIVAIEGGDIQVLPSGNYAEDYRGGIAGGVASGGGLSETDPVWTADKPNYVPYTGATTNITTGVFDVVANKFYGLFNWVVNTSSQSYLSFNGSSLSFNEGFLNSTINYISSRIKKIFITDDMTQSLVADGNNTLIEYNATNPSSLKQFIGIGIDGVNVKRLNNLIDSGSMPNLTLLTSDDGIVTTANITKHILTATAPGNAELLTGLGQEQTGIYNNDNASEFSLADNLTVFEKIENNIPNVVTIVIYGKNTTYIPLELLGNAKDDVDEWFNSPDELDDFLGGKDSRNISQKACEYISTYKDSDFFIWVYFGAPDETGEVYGENSTEYNQSIVNADDGIGVLIDCLTSEGIYDNVEIVGTSDHGFHENTTFHANTSDYNFPDTIEIPMFAKRSELISSYVDVRQQCSFTPTVLDYFGLEENIYEDSVDIGCRSMIGELSEQRKVTISNKLSDNLHNEICFDFRTNSTNMTCIRNNAGKTYFNGDVCNDKGDCLSDEVTPGNLSFNQTLTDSLYTDTQWGYNQTEALQVNTTQLDYTGFILSIKESWLFTFVNSWFGTKTTDDLTEGTTSLYDNQTWNESLADGKYALIGTGGNASFNQTLTDGLYNPILNNKSPIGLDVSNNIYLEPCPDTQILEYNSTLSGWQCAPKTAGAGGGTVTSVSGDGKYVLGTITSAGAFTFNETELNMSIDARAGGSGGTPGGSDTEIQFNDGGVFNGSVNMTFDKSTNLFKLNSPSNITGIHRVDNGTAIIESW